MALFVHLELSALQGNELPVHFDLTDKVEAADLVVLQFARIEAVAVSISFFRTLCRQLQFFVFPDGLIQYQRLQTFVFMVERCG